MVCNEGDANENISWAKYPLMKSEQNLNIDALRL